MNRKILCLICAVFVVSLTISPLAQRASAQNPDKAKVAAGLRTGFEEVSGWVTKSADMVPPEKYDYKPVDTVRTFGQLIAHVSDSLDYFCSKAGGTKMQGDSAEKGATDKATLVPKLKQAVDKCNAVYASDSAQFEPLMANVAHTNLHYGNLITYLRMMGMKPPSS
ncbi:MAG TPA: DinB family protein [Pyrinomonadaceae bacterium]